MPTKFIISTAVGVSAVSTTVAGVSYLFSLPKDLKGLLEKEGIKLLDIKANSKEWDKLSKKHTADSQISLSGDIKVSTITGLGDISSNGTEKLKKHCESLFKKTIEKNITFDTAKQNVKDWCSFESPILKEKVVAPISQTSRSDDGGTLRQ